MGERQVSKPYLKSNLNWEIASTWFESMGKVKAKNKWSIMSSPFGETHLICDQKSHFMSGKFPLPFGNFLTIPKAFCSCPCTPQKEPSKTRFMGPLNYKVLTLTKENAWLTTFFMFCCTTVGLCYKHIFSPTTRLFQFSFKHYKLYIRHNINTLSFLTSQKWRSNIEQCNSPRVFPTEPQSCLVNGRFPPDFHNNSLMFIL